MKQTRTSANAKNSMRERREREREGEREGRRGRGKERERERERERCGGGNYFINHIKFPRRDKRSLLQSCLEGKSNILFIAIFYFHIWLVVNGSRYKFVFAHTYS